MTVSVLYFAQIAEKLGLGSEEIELSQDANSDELIKILTEKYPVLQSLTFNIAVDQELVRKAVELKDGAEIALLPPFAGG